VNDELETIWKEVVWPNFKVLSRYPRKGAEENDLKPRSGSPVPGPRFERGTCRIRSRNVDLLTTLASVLSLVIEVIGRFRIRDGQGSNFHSKSGYPEISRDFPQFVQANAGEEHYTKPLPISFISFASYYLLIIQSFKAVQSELLTASLNEEQTKQEKCLQELGLKKWKKETTFKT
jgi:hypothetical protein